MLSCSSQLIHLTTSQDLVTSFMLAPLSRSAPRALLHIFRQRRASSRDCSMSPCCSSRHTLSAVCVSAEVLFHTSAQNCFPRWRPWPPCTRATIAVQTSKPAVRTFDFLVGRRRSAAIAGPPWHAYVCRRAGQNLTRCYVIDYFLVTCSLCMYTQKSMTMTLYNHLIEMNLIILSFRQARVVQVLQDTI